MQPFKRILDSCAAVVLITNVAAAQDDNIATELAHAAGYKAVFACGGVFNGGKTLDQIKADELVGVHPLYARHFNKLPDPQIDHENKRVLVVFDEHLPPRVSQWRPHLGCVSLPVGADPDAGDKVSRIDLPAVDARHDDGAPWTTRAEIDQPTGNAALDKIVGDLFGGGGIYGADQKTSALIVATPDRIFAEHYSGNSGPVTSQRTWSVAKSIAASVIGVAVQDGLISVDQPARLEVWASPLDPRKDITIQNLLNMASGLDSDRSGSHTPDLYFGGGRVEDGAMRKRLEAAPGSRWKYANNDTLLAVRGLRERIGDTNAYLKYPFERLLYRIGMMHTKPETDWDDNFILSSQVWTTARDLARLGVLHLQDGMWEGERVLPKGWARYVWQHSGPQPEGRDIGYGAQWWTYGGYDYLPEDAYAARGNRGQILFIIPSRNLVIVRRGYDPSGGEGIQMHLLARDILQALELSD